MLFFLRRTNVCPLLFLYAILEVGDLKLVGDLLQRGRLYWYVDRDVFQEYRRLTNRVEFRLVEHVVACACSSDSKKNYIATKPRNARRRLSHMLFESIHESIKG